MLSIAYRSSHGIHKIPLNPLCRLYLNPAKPSFGRPAALLARGYAKTAKAKAETKSKMKTKTKTAENPKVKAEAKASAKTKAKAEAKASEKAKSKQTEKTTEKPKNKAASLQSPKTPEELSSLWEKAMEVVGDMNKIGPTKLTGSQVTLMAGTLDVIKTVLTSRARKIGRADDTAPSTADADAVTSEPLDETTKSDTSSETPESNDPPLAPRRGRPSKKTSPGPGPLTPSPRKHRAQKSMIPASTTATKARPKDAETSEPVYSARVKKTKLAGTELEELEPIPVPTPPVPLIQYGLDRVLFNEGVYNLQDPRTGVFNFDPYLAQIMPVTEFDYDALKQYITSSKDEILKKVTKDLNKKYTGSTSSMTATLAHFHFLLSNWRTINNARISREYEPETQQFVSVMRAPAATFLNYNDGVYAIDADKEWDDETILSMLGKSMEMLLTAPREEYEKYRREVSHKLTEEERDKPESYHYTSFEDFVMRSQLDAYDPRLPGTGIYDLKTRAVVAIRMDAVNYKRGRSYELLKRTGEWESFEREYHDMIRGAFLKYSLQVRMGRMDGIFVAYHNTQRIFGFQYVPLEEMDHSIHGTMDKTLGDQEFKMSLKLWNQMLNKATERFPGQSLRVHVETRPSKNAFMYFFAESVTQEEINKIQVRDQKTVDRFRERVLGIQPPQTRVDEAGLAAETDEAGEGDVVPEDEELDPLSVSEKGATTEDELCEHASLEETSHDATDEASEEVWEDIMSVVEETMENDVRGITAIRDAIEEALQQSGLLKAKSSEEAQHYIDSLLKAIVDVEVEGKNKDEAEGEATTTSKEQTSSGSEMVEETSISHDDTSKAETPSGDQPTFGFISKLFSFAKSAPPVTEKPASQDGPGAPDDAADSQGRASVPDEAADAQNSDLVDLIKKMTSRVGIPSNEDMTQQEVSSDQAKLRKFETLLSELVTADDSAEAEAEAESEETTSMSKEEGEKIGAGSKKRNQETADAKLVFGMILTSRNKVNNDYVARPGKLSPEDEWDIEYVMEEIPQAKVQQLYTSLKTRRKKAHKKAPSLDRFGTLFNGELKRYSEKHQQYRALQDQLDAEQRPYFAIGNPQPFHMDQLKGFKVENAAPPNVEQVTAAKKTWDAKLQRFEVQVPEGKPERHWKKRGHKKAEEAEKAEEKAEE